MRSVTLKATMAQPPRSGAKPLGAKQGSHIVSFTADYLCRPRPPPGIPHRCLPGSDLKVKSLESPQRPLTEVPSSPYMAEYQ